MTEVFPEDVPANIANNSLLAVDLGQLTIRSDNIDITFEQLLCKSIDGIRLILITF